MARSYPVTGRRAERTLLLVALLLFVPLAQADELTGSRLSSTDADADGYADVVETASASDPSAAGSTPLVSAAREIDRILAAHDQQARASVRTAWSTTNATHDLGAAVVAGAIVSGRAAVVDSLAQTRAALAQAAADARPSVPPSEQPAFDETVAAVDLLLANAQTESEDALSIAAGMVGTAVGAPRAVVDGGFSFTLSRIRETFDSARMRVTATQTTADILLRASADFTYESEIRSATVGDEDGSGIPVQGAYVDLNGNGQRAADGSEDFTVTDRDQDRFTDKVELLAGSDRNDRRSTPEDADNDRWSTADEIFGATTVEQAALGWLDPKRTPVDSDGDGFANTEEDRDLDGIVEPPHETDPDDPESHPRPTALFSATPGDPTTLTLVQFTDASVYEEPHAPPESAIVAWFWDFGDEGTSTQRHPVHQFADDGTFTVRLTVRENHGAIDTTSMVITVTNVLPVPSFDLVSTPSLADPVARFDASASADPDGDVVRYRWDFGDGSAPVETTVPTIAHAYPAPGTHTVTLEVTDDDDATVALAVDLLIPNVEPLAAFHVAPPPARVGFPVEFLDASQDPLGPIVAWHWEFGDGSTATTQHPTHVYAAAGLLDVTLTVTDDQGAADSVTTQIRVFDPPTVDFAMSTPRDDVTPIDFTDLTAAGGAPLVSWAWTFGDGATSDAQNPAHLYDDDGVYVVTLVVTDADGITGTLAQPIVIDNVAPTASFVAPPGELLTSMTLAFHADVADVDGDVVSIAWDMGDGTLLDGLDVQHRYASDPTSDSRDFVVTLVVTDDDGAQSVAFARTITVLQDTDEDGIPDLRDGDADDDGFTNVEEGAAGSDPRDARSTPPDLDGDGIPNLADRTLGNALGRPASERDPCAPVRCV